MSEDLGHPELGTSTLRLQAGGTLGDDAFYIERPADRDLLEGLTAGELCYVLSTRQIGKSSLRHRTAGKLRAQGTLCVTIDLTRVGSDDATPENWYFDLTYEIGDQLRLGRPDAFWNAHPRIGPVHAFARYLSDEVLAKTTAPVVIFIDEIDATLALPFSRDDFFAALRAFYNERPDRPEHQRLTFCLLGVAAPGDLIEDPTRTPFNVGHAVRIEDFKRAEISALAPGLAGTGRDPEELLDEVFAWTSGHPYMTLRTCDDLVRDGGGASVEAIIEERFLRRGRTEDANLAYAEKHFDISRMRGTDARAAQMLALYERLLRGDVPTAEGDDPTQLALRLAGLAADRTDARGRRVLGVRNRIFSEVFDLSWARSKQAERLIAEPRSRWLDSGKKDDFLLRGEALSEVRRWAGGRDDLSREEREFLEAGVLADQREKARAAEARARAQEARAKAELTEELDRMKKDHDDARLVVDRIRKAEERVKVAEGRARAAEERASTVEQESELLARRFRDAEPDHKRTLASQKAIWDSAMGDQQRLAEAERRRLKRKIPLVYAWIMLAAVVIAALVAFSVRGWSREMERNREPEAKAARADAAEKRARENEKRARENAEREAHIKEVWRLAGRAQAAGREGASILRLLLSVEALRRAQEERLDNDDTKLFRYALVDALRGVPARRPLPAACEGDIRGVGPGAERIVFGCGKGEVCLCDVTQGKSILEVSASHAAFSLDGRRLATLAANAVDVWNTRDGTRLRPPIPVKDITSVALSPDGEKLVTASSNGTAGIWSLDGKAALLPLLGHKGAVTKAVFSPDGRRVLTTSKDHTARFWSIDGKTWKELEHDHEVTDAAFDRDGRYIATASNDTVYIWSIDGKPINSLNRLPGATVAFSGPSSSLLIASTDGTDSTVWRVAPGYEAPESPIIDVSKENIGRSVLSADGRCVVTTSRAGKSWIWDLEMDPPAGDVGFGRVISPEDDDKLVKIACDKAGRNLSRDEWHKYIGDHPSYRRNCEKFPEE